MPLGVVMGTPGLGTSSGFLHLQKTIMTDYSTCSSPKKLPTAACTCLADQKPNDQQQTVHVQFSITIALQTQSCSATQFEGAPCMVCLQQLHPMIGCVSLCHAVLRHAVLRCAVLPCRAMSCSYSMHWCAVLCHAVLCHAVLCHALL